MDLKNYERLKLIGYLHDFKNINSHLQIEGIKHKEYLEAQKKKMIEEENQYLIEVKKAK